jgi:hypothetical protein
MINKTTLSLITLVISGIFGAYYCFMIPHPHTDLNGIEYASTSLTLAAFYLGTQLDDIIIAFNTIFKSNKSTC